MREEFKDILLGPLFAVRVPSQQICVYYLLGALAFALLAYILPRQGPGEKGPLRGFFRYCFPRRIYTHPSSVVDYAFFYVNAVVMALLFGPALGLILPATSSLVQSLLQPLHRAGVLGPVTLRQSVLYALISMTVLDFAIFYTHYLQHKVPLLWEFHKVHHSAQVLNPITVFRMHPVDLLFTIGLGALLQGIADGVFHYLHAGRVSYLEVYGVNLFTFLFFVLGYNLRHTHIWLDYGPALSRILISPAQHQIHHSAEERHFDRNLGYLFAFWDGMFGTLHVPRGREDFALGLYGGEHREYPSVGSLYLRPFAKAFALLRQGSPAGLLCAAALVFGTALLLYPRAPALGVGAGAGGGPSVHLEDLTWMEVRDRVQAGFTTAIVPTGGTEQGGPHLVLGKHNFIVRHTAGRIAKELGHALVAPVIAYVPEGDLSPPSGHMSYPGTLTVSDEVFGKLLEAAARSLKAHGFRLICFVGDHGWNQGPQQKVAQALSQQWRQDGVRVVSVDDYYFRNGQDTWLLQQGESAEDIGSHAGMRDTSELMAVDPPGVRGEALRGATLKDLHDHGVIGDPRRASRSLGERMLTLKVQAAVAQIRRLEQDRP